MSNTKKIKVKHWKLVNFILVIYDCFAMAVSYFAALWLRFEFSFSEIRAEGYLKPYLYFLPCYIVIGIGIFIVFRMYRRVWRFVSVNDILFTSLGSLVASLLHVFGITFVCEKFAEVSRMPASYYVLGTVLQLLMIIFSRCAYKVYLYLLPSAHSNTRRSDKVRKVMIIGAGEAGQLLMRDLNSPYNNYNLKVTCMIDDNPNKHKRFIEGIPIIGGRDKIIEAVNKYNIEVILITMPSATNNDIAEILDICSNTGCEIKKLPGLFKNIKENISLKDMKNISPDDLLGRDPINADMKEIFAFIRDKVILVTGGGGSIGSELCRQIAAHKPQQLIIYDIYENNAYDIQLELKEKYPYIKLDVIIGSVRDAKRLSDVFSKYRPDVVYHAAAHKHVPLMEDSPCEAIKNNVFGTYMTAYASIVYGVSRFVMISTDKAVNPTNIMGASKRMCEMVVQSFDKMIKDGKVSDIPFFGENPYINCDLSQAHTEFVAVRFGNVLGSNGSVVPVFLKQIENGGPVTVTHPDIIRYFMTIPEAVSLVLLAGTYAKGGEIFVLDMGKPVKIDTLARNLIRLSGYKPDEDIKVVYTGLRPGEKLYEEKLMAEEGIKKTENELIHIGAPIPFDVSVFYSQLSVLFKEAFSNSDCIADTIKTIVTTYKNPVRTQR